MSMRRVMSEIEVAERMNAMQDLIDEGWNAQCAREAYRILKSWERHEARESIANFSVGDSVTFDSGRVREGARSIRTGIVTAVHQTRLSVKVGGETGKWRVPCSLIIDQEASE